MFFCVYLMRILCMIHIIQLNCTIIIIIIVMMIVKSVSLRFLYNRYRKDSSCQSSSESAGL